MLKGKDESYYLTSGKRTEVGEKVKELADKIQETNTKEIVDQIIEVMLKYVPMKRDSQTEKKFRRSTEEIISDKSRNGCCDSSTVFVTLCRAKGIPAVQVITADLYAMIGGNPEKGHFYSAYFSKENGDWVLIDSDVDEKNIKKRGVYKRLFNPNSEFIRGCNYIFAIERDYSDFDIDGIKIDSKRNMHTIHKYVLNKYMTEHMMENLKKRNKLEEILMSEEKLSIEYLESKKEEIFEIIPELRDEEGFDQKNEWHIYDVWTHTEVALANSKQDFEERLALLLHDIGKPYSYQEENGVRHFKGHAGKSEKMVKIILTKLGYSRKEIDPISFLVGNHSRSLDFSGVNKMPDELAGLYNKLIDIKCCDAKAYNPEKTEAELQKLERIRKQINSGRKNYKMDYLEF